MSPSVADAVGKESEHRNPSLLGQINYVWGTMELFEFRREVECLSLSGRQLNVPNAKG
jgi:hypothetical protein